MLPKGFTKVTLSYIGDRAENRSADGKVWFSVDGEATLFREIHMSLQGENPRDVSASVHVIPRWSQPSVGNRDPTYEDDCSAAHELVSPVEEQLPWVPHISSGFAPATSLEPGIHVMCHVTDTSSQRLPSEKTGPDVLDSTGEQTEASASSIWSRILDAAQTNLGAGNDVERLIWRDSCLKLLTEAAECLDSTAISSVVAAAPREGWALLPCAPDGSVPCSLAMGEPIRSGAVMWFHHSTAVFNETGAAVVESVLGSNGTVKPALASIWAHPRNGDVYEIVAKAHGTVPRGILRGYDLGQAKDHDQDSPPPADNSETTERQARCPAMDSGSLQFLNLMESSTDVFDSWQGMVSSEELPGGGLHRQVRVSVDAKCNPTESCSCAGGSWCEILLSQHLSQGVYIDIDEAKARHDFNVSSSPQLVQGGGGTDVDVSVETYGGAPIDVELPASVSGQHVVNFLVRVDGTVDGRVQTELTLPVHLRYPEPSCGRPEQDCEAYAWVEVPAPLVGLRCGGGGKEEAEAGLFTPLRLTSPPRGVALPVPRGLLWHRGIVVWGTAAAATLGMVYTLRTIIGVELRGRKTGGAHQKTP